MVFKSLRLVNTACQRAASSWVSIGSERSE